MKLSNKYSGKLIKSHVAVNYKGVPAAEAGPVVVAPIPCKETYHPVHTFFANEFASTRPLSPKSKKPCLALNPINLCAGSAATDLIAFHPSSYLRLKMEHL